MSASEPQAEQPCKHQWISVDEYDSDNDEVRYSLQCRLCGEHSLDDIETEIHGMRYVSVRFPIASFERDYKKPMRFGGTGLNHWYPAETEED